MTWADLLKALASAGLGLLAGLILFWIKDRCGARKAAAIAIYTELIDRVIRCYYDYSHPWYAVHAGKDLRTRSLADVKKFRPVPPVLYPAFAKDLSLLGGRTAAKLARFYSLLDAVRRDIDHIGSDELDSNGKVELSSQKMVSRRLAETIGAALEALLALQGKYRAEERDIEQSTLDSFRIDPSESIVKLLEDLSELARNAETEIGNNKFEHNRIRRHWEKCQRDISKIERKLDLTDPST